MHETRRWPAAAALWTLIAITITPAWADEADTSEAGAYILQAEMALQRDDYLMAAQEYRKAAELSDDPDVARQAVLVGMAYGFNREALAAAKRWHKLDKSNNEARVFLAQLSFRLGDLKTARRQYNYLIEESDEAPGDKLVARSKGRRQADAVPGPSLPEFLTSPLRCRGNGSSGRRCRICGKERVARDRTQSGQPGVASPLRSGAAGQWRAR
jgi:tetratricopeptide (TPR) repeat protein